jgi:sugar/nucleoside kinase (ribokinase family)
LDPDGRLIVAGADMDLLKAPLPALDAYITTKTPLVCLDGNLATEMNKVVLRATEANVPIWFEPTSVPKSLNIMPFLDSKTVMYTSPNRGELDGMATAAVARYGDKRLELSFDAFDSNGHKVDSVMGTWMKPLSQLLAFVPVVILKLGGQGVALAYQTKESHGSVHLFRPRSSINVVNVTGAGDSLVHSSRVLVTLMIGWRDDCSTCRPGRFATRRNDA